MTRRRRAVAPAPLALSVMFALLCGCAPGAVDDGGDDHGGRRPDVVLVVIDTLRADRTTVLAPSLDTTPHLAALGRRGTVFTQAIASSTWTVPSMVALFTGAEITRHRDRTIEDLPSLPERFVEAGYRTACFSSQALMSRATGLHRGFQHRDVMKLAALKGIDGDDVDEVAAVRERWRAGAVVSRALDWYASTDDGRPVFLYVHLLDPHLPYDPDATDRLPPDPDWSLVTPDAAPEVLWTEAPTPAQAALLTRRRRQYDGMIASTDAALGRLFAADGVDRDRAALVAVTSDHGEGMSVHARGPDEPGAVEPLDASYYIHGHQRYDEALRVPIWLAGPGVPAGRRESRMVAQRDLASTLLALVDVPAPTAPLPLADDDPAPRTVLGADRVGWFARREGRKLLVPYPSSRSPERQTRYVEVAVDRYLPELEDLAPRERHDANALSRELKDWRAAHDDSAPEQRDADSAELDAMLEALGYVDDDEG